MSAARKGLRFTGQLLVIGLITFAMGEAASRWILGLRPLSAGDMVYERDPVRGWRQRPGSQDLFVKIGCQQEIQINSRGLREREISYEKGPGTTRVLVIGDSAVVGFEVPQESLWTRVAESDLRSRGYGVEFINGGTRGYGTDQSLLFLKREGMKYQPDLVLYFWNDNDPDDNVTVHRPFRVYGKPYFDLDANGSLVLEGSPVPEFPYSSDLRVDERGDVQESEVPRRVRFRIWIRDNVVGRSAFGAALVHVAFAVPQIAGRARGSGTYQQETIADRQKTRAFDVTAALMREMHQASLAAEADFRVITSSELSKALVSAAGVGFLDPMRSFEESVPEGPQITIPFDAHWNELGHRLFGEAVASAIVSGGVIKRDDG